MSVHKVHNGVNIAQVDMTRVNSFENMNKVDNKDFKAAYGTAYDSNDDVKGKIE